MSVSTPLSSLPSTPSLPSHPTRHSGEGTGAILVSLRGSRRHCSQMPLEVILCDLPELAIHLLVQRLELLSCWPHGPALLGFPFYSGRRQIVNVEAKSNDFQRDGYMTGREWGTVTAGREEGLSASPGSCHLLSEGWSGWKRLRTTCSYLLGENAVQCHGGDASVITNHPPCYRNPHHSSRG